MRRDAIRQVDLEELRQRAFDRGDVLLDHLGALDGVRLLDRFADLRDRPLAREDARDGEEASLHDRVRPRAHARLAGDLGRVDDPQGDVLVHDRLLNLEGKLGPQ